MPPPVHSGVSALLLLLTGAAEWTPVGDESLGPRAALISYRVGSPLRSPVWGARHLVSLQLRFLLIQPVSRDGNGLCWV